MKKMLFFVAAMGAFLSLCAQESQEVYLSGTDKDHTVNWQFKCTDGARSGEWSTIPVPSCWELQGFGGYNYGHDRNPHSEHGLYRTQFEARREWRKSRTYIVFEGVMTDAEVKVNGQLAGPIHQGAFYRFKYDISKLLNYGGQNTLEIEVSKESSNRSINNAERRADYWIFGGIFRPVYLRIEPQTFVDHVAIDARHTGVFTADVVVNRMGAKHLGVEVAIEDAEGKVVASLPTQTMTSDSLRVNLQAIAPRAWTAETPNLYTARFTLREGRKAIHTYRQRFGFRTIEFRSNDGFYVNGTKIKFKGVCRHTFWPESGRTSSKTLAIEDVNLIKDMNMNAVRMSHYPPDTYFLDVCDSLGLYVIDELAGWQSAYDSITACRLVPVMIRRDVNHPSIIIWSNGNEGGFPKAARPLYAKYDIQGRHVVEPTTRYDGTDTHHYPRYGTTLEKASRNDIVYMPTESLHGLHDGGHGAGLEDYWEVIRTKPNAAGQFLWDLADEGVVRRDIHDSIDVFNDKAPDGIVGPHHEKEGSFYAIREIWSPIYIAQPDFSNFNGTLHISNRYHFTRLGSCKFDAKLSSLPRQRRGGGGQEAREANVRTDVPDLAPWTEDGTMRLSMPNDWQTYDLLSITATDPSGRKVMTWTWPINSAEQIMDRMLERMSRMQAQGQSQSESPRITENNTLLTVSTSQLEVSFDKTTGLISAIRSRGENVPLTGGPKFVGLNAKFQKLEHRSSTDGYQVDAIYDEGVHATWTFSRGGMLKLDYTYHLDGEYDFVGITFNYPENEVQGAVLMSDGPYRVWKNRLKGVSFGVYDKTYNNTITGQTWEYPEFKGYYSHFASMRLRTAGRSFSIFSGTNNLYLHLFTPEKPVYMSRNIDPPFPDGQISVLNCIPAIGNKFAKAADEGPQGAKARFNNETFKGQLYFRF